MPSTINQGHIAALAFIVNAIRPDWDRRGIEAQLARLDPAVSLAAITHAAVVAAVTRPDQRTPAVIAMAGPHWAGCLDERPSVRLATWRAHDNPDPVAPEVIEAHRARLRGALERNPSWTS